MRIATTEQSDRIRFTSSVQIANILLTWPCDKIIGNEHRPDLDLDLISSSQCLVRLIQVIDKDNKKYNSDRQFVAHNDTALR